MTSRFVTILGLAAVLSAGPAAAFDPWQTAKDALERKAQQKTDEAVDQGADEAVEGATSAGRKPAEEGSKAAGGQGSEAAAARGAAGGTEADNLKPGQGAWANYDFKPGSRILYADDFTKDEVGDFPRRLEFVEGTMEVVEWKKARWLRLTSTSRFNVPVPEVLPDRYTMEFDYYAPGGEMWVYPDQKTAPYTYLVFGRDGTCGVNAENRVSARSEGSSGLSNKILRARVMADGAYVKVYVNDARCANVPNFGKLRSNKIMFWSDANAENPTLFGSFRIAAGGKKLYEALATAGRVATQGIYFDTGSDRIRPESTPTLKEIAAMLSDHSELKLLIEGHTDSVGQAAANQVLSEKRAASVKKALVETFGVDGARLTTKGLGASKSVASNETPEGRQNNRRVELVKI